jgi:hypothetical protein
VTADVDSIFKLVELLLLPFSWYVVRRLDTLADSISTLTQDTRELKTILIGTDGKNGIRSRVIRLERKVENLSLRQASRHNEEHDVDDDNEE